MVATGSAKRFPCDIKPLTCCMLAVGEIGLISGMHDPRWKHRSAIGQRAKYSPTQMVLFVTVSLAPLPVIIIRV